MRGHILYGILTDFQTLTGKINNFFFYLKSCKLKLGSLHYSLVDAHIVIKTSGNKRKTTKLQFSTFQISCSTEFTKVKY